MNQIGASPHALLSSLVLVAASEMGDKTQLLAFSLSARFRKPVPILLGIFVATLVNHGLAAGLGSWGALRLDSSALRWVLGLGFIFFGIWTLQPDQFEESENKRSWGPFWTTLVLFFLAEMGDKTQIATLALGARFQAPWAVTAGTTMGMLVTDGLAVFLGDRMAARVNMKWVRRVAAGLFFVFGVLILLGVGGGLR